MSHELPRPPRKGRNCILHIGMHKTGSSSIQHALIQAEPSPDWSLVRSKTGNAGFALHAVFGSPENGQATLKRIGLTGDKLVNFSKNARRRLKQSISTPSPLCVLSSEALTRLDAEELTALKTWLLKWVERIRVVGYVRGPHEFMESSLQERIKTGQMKRLHLERAYPDYQLRFEKFDQVFGRDQVELRPFDPATFPQGDVVQDFVRWVGIPLPASQTARANEGLSGPALRLLHACNGIALTSLSLEQRHKAQHRLAVSLQSLVGPKLRLSPALLAPLLGAQRDDLDWIAQRLGQPLRLTRPPKPDTDLTDLDALKEIGPDAVAWLRKSLAEADISSLSPAPGYADIAQAMVKLLIHHAQRRQLPSEVSPDAADDDPGD
jgi:hypothetical protein